METAQLKSFATWARTALIREVAARIAVVLAPASPERVEQSKAVEVLEKAVTAVGGGDKGKAAVADRVAYTWFNRIIALRFMDANGYTDIGVVSPQTGVETGQPEILAEAKRGNIDAAVAGTKTRDKVTALLNGTRRSDDAQGEAYALLLADYCRYWNRAMPFMFEREGDYTELLIPANLLADDSVASRAVKVLTKDVCQDVEVIGWLYQFYISERKDEVFAGFKKNKKAGADEIPAATQLFTPHWIVRYLVENSLGRLWMLNRPSSRLVGQMDYYIVPVDEETDFLKIASPEELKVVDPACGSGHMLTYAFDLLYAIYEEEGYAPAEIPGLILTNNLYGVEIDPRAGALAAFALTMKARAKQRTFFSKHVAPNVCVLEPISFIPGEINILVTRSGDRAAEEAFWNQFQHADAFGSLIRPREELIEPLRAHLDRSRPDDGDMVGSELWERAHNVIRQAECLLPRYNVVVANPPYMGAGNMDTCLGEFVKARFPGSKHDLFAAFIERNLNLSVFNGQVAMITMQSWMFLSSFEKLRKRIANNYQLLSMAHLGTNAFDSIGGQVVSTTAFVIGVDSPRNSAHGTYVRLVEGTTESEKASVLRQVAAGTNLNSVHRVRNSDLAALPGAVIAYWVAEKIAPAFASGVNLASVAYTRIGLITGDNDTYLRQWFEVSVDGIGTAVTRDRAAESGLRWFPISKGGEYRKWYGNVTAVVDWQHDGHQLQTRLDRTGSRVLAHNFNLDDIFREGVTWSKISSGRFSGRYHPAGYIFNDPSTNIFPSNSSVSVLMLLAYLSSNVTDFLLHTLNPTLNFQPGNVASLPWPTNLPVARIEEISQEALSIARADWDEAEVSREFSMNSLVKNRGSGLSLVKILDQVIETFGERSKRLAELERQNNSLFAEALGLAALTDPVVGLADITLNSNADWLFAHVGDVSVRNTMLAARMVEELVSYAVGCMFGRYSIDKPGLILANHGHTLQYYLAEVSNPSLLPDSDNVIPIVDGDWFEDDIVARFRQFIRATFGEQHFEENLRFVTESLGVKDIRDYFLRSFYKDHVRRYKKRPIYWLFSSPKGSFNALIYMHRYTPSTVSTVLNEYLREFRAKLTASLQQQELLAAGGGTPRQQAAAQKEADRLRKVLLELEEYEHDVLYPLASRQLTIDLDDGVKANYPKFGAALKKIPGLGGSDD